jgi:hypothetical protein
MHFHVSVVEFKSNNRKKTELITSAKKCKKKIKNTFQIGFKNFHILYLRVSKIWKERNYVLKPKAKTNLDANVSDNVISTY